MDGPGRREKGLESSVDGWAGRREKGLESSVDEWGKRERVREFCRWMGQGEERKG